MNIKIYQSFYLPEHFASLEKPFIPYPNLENKNPELREYPLILDLFSKNRDFDGYWGLVSWKFHQKTRIFGADFIQMIEKNPGYDVYHFNPMYSQTSAFINPFVNGDVHHPGMLSFVNRLLSLMGYDVDMSKITLEKENCIFCSYYVGNARFWNQWMGFLDGIMFIANKDPQLNSYLYATHSNHFDQKIINFSFVIERMVNLFLYLYESQYKIKGFR
jgi:hypothetical protein